MNWRWAVRWGCVSCTLPVLFVVGCRQVSDEPERAVVFGKASFNGTPIEVGEIRFDPIDGTQAPATGAPIVKGAYRVDHKGGLPVGAFRIRVLGYAAPGTVKEGETLGAPSNDPMAAREQYIPDSHSTEASPLKIVVPSGSPPIEQNIEIKATSGAK